jgi:transcriptional regulatory protein RtcR
MATVALGFYGTQLDAGRGSKRWSRWRPTISLCQHDDLLIDRLVLLVSREGLADGLLDDLKQVSPHTTVEQWAVPLKDPWDFEEVYGALHDAARRLELDDDDELLVHITTGTHVAQICLFLLTESRFLPGRLLQTSPPRARGGQPSYAVIDLDLARYDQLAERFAQTQREGTDLLKQGIATRNEAFNELIDQLGTVAVASTAPILLTGPTGAGKSHLARRIYELKRARRQLDGPLVEVNCATLRGDQAMSALFGHRRGAFTGAVADRDGLLLAAHGGLLFLDEIGELGLDEQAMLLRAVEERRFLPVGSEREVRSDFQLVAGTNRDLREEVRQGRFREDLLARIDLWSIELPALRDRPEDLEPNLDHELERFARSAGRRVAFNREARQAFVDFARGPEGMWRGNFRDLSAAVTRMATLSPGGRIGEDQVAAEIGRLRRAWGLPGAKGVDDRVTAVLGAEAAEQLDRFDRVQLDDVLAVCERCHTLSEAGRTLFAVSRTKRSKVNDADRLRKYLAKHALTFDAVQERLAR